jgi:hypothetical protein
LATAGGFCYLERKPSPITLAVHCGTTAYKKNRPTEEERMNRKPASVLSIAGLVLASLMATAPPARADGAVLLKVGGVRLGDENQFLAGTNRKFENSSARTFSVAWEARKRRSGAAFGVEYLIYRHDFTPGALITGEGQAKTQTLMFRATKYFGRADVRPFIGVGFGPGHTSVSGTNLDPEINLMLQAAAGVEFRVENFSFLVEARALHNDSDGETGNEYDPSGTGLFGGIGFLF